MLDHAVIHDRKIFKANAGKCTYVLVFVRTHMHCINKRGWVQAFVFMYAHACICRDVYRYMYVKPVANDLRVSMALSFFLTCLCNWQEGIYVCIRMYTSICVLLYVYIYACMCIFTSVCVCVLYVYVYIYIYIVRMYNMQMHTCDYQNALHTHRHVYIHMYIIHKYIHMYIIHKYILSTSATHLT